MSKEIDLIRNTDCQKRPNLYYVIDIGCSFDKNENKKYYLIARAQLYPFN